MKKVLLALVIAAGIGMVSCKSNSKNEGSDTVVDTATAVTDSIPPATETIAPATDSVPMSDTIPK